MSCIALRELLVVDADPDAVLARRSGLGVSQAEFRAAVGAWLVALRDRDGQHCALYEPDGVAFLAALFGAWLAGKTVWLPGDTLPATVRRLSGEVDTFIGAFSGPDTCRPAGDGLPPARTVPAELDTALVMYTSGSTGEPAAITKTFDQLDREINALQSQWGERVARATVLATVPHQHMYGLLFKLLWPLARGAPFVAHSIDYAEELVAALGDEPGVCITSPAFLKRMPQGPEWTMVRARLKAIYSSGGPLPLEVAQHTAQLFGQGVVEVYGSTETGGVAHRIQTAPATRWRALPGVTVRQDPPSRQLAIRSGWVSADEQSPSTWISQDRGEVFEGGEFTLLGRVDRIVKVEEKRVSLTALEQVLKGCVWVRDARVLQLAEGRLGAVVVPDAEGWNQLAQRGRRALAERLREALAPGVERVVLPRKWRFVAQLPENELGKVSQVGLVAQFEVGSMSGLPLIRQETAAPGRVELSLVISPDLPWFDGHFADAPVLPGVVQVHWAIVLGRKYLAVQGRFARLEKVKFQRVISPGMQVALILEHAEHDDVLSFLYRSESATHGQGRVVFER